MRGRDSAPSLDLADILTGLTLGTVTQGLTYRLTDAGTMGGLGGVTNRLTEWLSL